MHDTASSRKYIAGSRKCIGNYKRSKPPSIQVCGKSEVVWACECPTPFTSKSCVSVQSKCIGCKLCHYKNYHISISILELPILNNLVSEPGCQGPWFVKFCQLSEHEEILPIHGQGLWSWLVRDQVYLEECWASPSHNGRYFYFSK